MSDHQPTEHEKHLEASRQYWNNEATRFDNEPDHGLRDPQVRSAWVALIQQLLSGVPEPARILDIGCGTGSLSLILAELGHQVTGIDLAPAMIEVARHKAITHAQTINFHVMDASFPQFPPQNFDVIVCRHLLWALPDPELVLQRWVDLLRAGGRLILIEGFWSTGGGLHADEIVGMLPDTLTDVETQNLSNQATLWGREVSDERYVIRATSPQ